MAKTIGTLLKHSEPKEGMPGTKNVGQAMLRYMKNKFQLMTAIDLVVMFLWIGTLLMMVDFIAVVAVPNQPKLEHADATAALGGLFALCICAAIITTVVARYLQKRRESGKV